MTGIVERPDDNRELALSSDNHPMSLTLWQAWIDDLPLPSDFNEGQDALQEYMQALADHITALEADLAEARRLLENARQIERNVQAAREHEFKRAETAEARAYELAVAIMGGEDAPGYADSIPTDQLVELQRKNRLMDQDAAPAQEER